MKTLFDSPEIISDEAAELFKRISELSLEEKIQTINSIRLALKEYSPFSFEPVDCVQWVHTDNLTANDYNPNSVAPPEMALLELSILEDGYTQPIVAWPVEGGFEVVDGFHRNRVGRESGAIRSRIHGYLPITAIRNDRTDRGDRIASTIRHNRARGKHGVQSMSDIVIELKKRNWSTTRIGKELGMDEDEILRLCQISGLSEVFSDQDFSEAWEAALFVDSVADEDIDLDPLEESSE